MTVLGVIWIVLLSIDRVRGLHGRLESRRQNGSRESRPPTFCRQTPGTASERIANRCRIYLLRMRSDPLPRGHTRR